MASYKWTAADKKRLQNGINWYILRTAYEDNWFDAQVVDEISNVAAASGFTDSNGTFKAIIRDRPISLILQWILFVAPGFSPADRNRIQLAIDMMVKRQAYENPLDAQVIDQLGPAAVSSGHKNSHGDFKNDYRDRPLSSLLQWLLLVGS